MPGGYAAAFILRQLGLIGERNMGKAKVFEEGGHTFYIHQEVYHCFCVPLCPCGLLIKSDTHPYFDLLYTEEEVGIELGCCDPVAFLASCPPWICLCQDTAEGKCIDRADEDHPARDWVRKNLDLSKWPKEDISKHMKKKPKGAASVWDRYGTSTWENLVEEGTAKALTKEDFLTADSEMRAPSPVDTMEQRGVAQVPGGTFNVTVPPGAVPGMPLSVEVPNGLPGAGQHVEVMVPPGVQAGQMIAVPLPNNTQLQPPQVEPQSREEAAPPALGSSGIDLRLDTPQACPDASGAGGDLKSWLDKHSLGRIEDQLRALGAAAVDDLSELNASDLDDMDLKPIEKKRLLRALGL